MQNQKNKKIIVIGGGAGGGSFAAKIRRLDNDAQITIYERSPFVSYSNCGQPYLISGEISSFKNIIVYSPENWKDKYNVDALVLHEVISIDRKSQTVMVKNLVTNEIFKDSYDKLMIASGTSAIMPSIPGINEANNLHVLKTPDHLQHIMKDLNTGMKKAVVIGAGFIGVEIAENCKKRGMDVDLINLNTQLLAKILDEDYSVFIKKSLIENGVNLKLNTSVTAIENNGKIIVLSTGEKIKADIIFMVVGVEAQTQMFKIQQIKTGITQGILINKFSQTNDSNIYATGDIAETVDWYGNPSRIQLAIVSQRLSIIAANHIYGVHDEFRGVQNSASISIFDTTIASVGYTEKYLINKNIKYKKVAVIDAHRVIKGQKIFLKVLYDFNGYILGAQAAGPHSTEKRINYIAMAIMYKIPIEDLLHFQIAYNPIVDTQRDIVNLIARIARAQNSGATENITVTELDKYLKKNYVLLDVRTLPEWNNGHHEKAILFPLQDLTKKINTLDKNKKYILYCKLGARAYNFQMRLKNAGFTNVINLLGAWEHMKIFNDYKYKI